MGAGRYQWRVTPTVFGCIVEEKGEEGLFSSGFSQTLPYGTLFTEIPVWLQELVMEAAPETVMPADAWGGEALLTFNGVKILLTTGQRMSEVQNFLGERPDIVISVYPGDVRILQAGGKR